MSKYEIVLAPSAESDVADAYRWYRERNAMAVAHHRRRPSYWRTSK